jgi:hypothetical protein
LAINGRGSASGDGFNSKSKGALKGVTEGELRERWRPCFRVLDCPD